MPATGPTVDWAETESLEVLASCEHFSSPWVRLNQVLGRRAAGLWLYVHEVRWRDGELERECISKTLIPEPLDAGECRIQKDGVHGWSLFLALRGTGRCSRQETSRVTEESGWLTEESEAGADQLQFHARDRGVLERLRDALVGTASETSMERQALREDKLGHGFADQDWGRQPVLNRVEHTEAESSMEPGTTSGAFGSHFLPRLKKLKASMLKRAEVGGVPPANAA